MGAHNGWRAVTTDGCYDGWRLHRKGLTTDGGYNEWRLQRMAFVAGGYHKIEWKGEGEQKRDKEIGEKQGDPPPSSCLCRHGLLFHLPVHVIA